MVEQNITEVPHPARDTAKDREQTPQALPAIPDLSIVPQTGAMFTSILPPKSHTAIQREVPFPIPSLAFCTQRGRVYVGDSLQLFQDATIIRPGSVNLIMTSPPFGLVRKKDYGNVDADDYVAWFRSFAVAFHKVLADNGSLVIDIGGVWNAGLPTRNLYHYELLIMLCKEAGFHLAQEFYWWNPSKLPSPAEWVTVRRIRVKDAINCVWWLSKTPWPKASNTRVLQPYSDSMLALLTNGYQAKVRPSGHDISDKFLWDNGASIPPNLIAIPNTESNSSYLRYCKKHRLPLHPARYPAALPEYFIRMLTDADDLVVDPFAGSCVTGEVAERLDRQWICVELLAEYLEGAKGRFVRELDHSNANKPPAKQSKRSKSKSPQAGDHGGYYKVPRPGLMWSDADALPPLSGDGGKRRVIHSDGSPRLMPGAARDVHRGAPAPEEIR